MADIYNIGLDSLVLGSSDPKRKAMLKGPQSRSWSTFIEAVTADGRALKPGIIFKGKDLQKQWFLAEFREIADWFYVTSPNGWTNDHLGYEWLEQVYLPQTQPEDPSDARLLILDGHGSHATVHISLFQATNVLLILGQEEWMATCFLNNVYCCYLPAHTSHGLQPLDNGIFNVVKAFYRKELEKLAILTDSAPVDKVNFIRCYAEARKQGFTQKNIQAAWRTTGNWPISRRKALSHPEIQPDVPKSRPVTPHPTNEAADISTPKTSREIRDMGKERSPHTRRLLASVAKGWEAKEFEIVSLKAQIEGLEAQLEKAGRGRKRKAIPNPNKRFMNIEAVLTSGEAPQEAASAEIADEVVALGAQEVGGSSSEDEDSSEGTLPQIFTRSGRAVKRTRRE